MVQYLDKQMDTFQVCQLIVSDVHAHREKKSCISPVDNFVCAELQKNPILVTRGNSETEEFEQSIAEEKDAKYCRKNS